MAMSTYISIELMHVIFSDTVEPLLISSTLIAIEDAFRCQRNVVICLWTANMLACWLPGKAGPEGSMGKKFTGKKRHHVKTQ